MSIRVCVRACSVEFLFSLMTTTWGLIQPTWKHTIQHFTDSYLSGRSMKNLVHGVCIDVFVGCRLFALLQKKKRDLF